MSYVTMSPEQLTLFLNHHEPHVLNELKRLDERLTKIKSNKPTYEFLWFTWTGDIDHNTPWLHYIDADHCEKSSRLFTGFRRALAAGPTSVSVDIKDIRNMTWYTK